MRTDYDIDCALLQALPRLFVLGGCSEAAHHFHIDRIIFDSLNQAFKVLGGKNRRRYQKCNLLIVLYSFESGSDRDRKSTRLNSSHVSISYAVFCLKKKI